MSPECPVGIFPVGSGLCLLLRTVCEHGVSFGHVASWFWRESDVEDVLAKHLCGTLYGASSWRICDSSVFWCVSAYSICVIGIFVVFGKMGNSGSIH